MNTPIAAPLNTQLSAYEIILLSDINAFHEKIDFKKFAIIFLIVFFILSFLS